MVQGIPVVIADNGKGIPVRAVTDNAPLMTVAPNGKGAPIVLSELGAPFVVQGVEPPIPPVPGPLDYIENGEGLSNITVEYDLARPVAMLGVAFRFDGPVTALTATHGGDALTAIGFVLDDQTNIGSATFIGNGLVVEPANLVITPVGGTIGPAVLRIDDSFMIDNVEVGIVGEQNGASYIGAAQQPAPVVFSPVTGDGWGVYGLACASAEKFSGARGLNGAAPVESLFWGVASSGTLQPVPDWATIGAGWTQDGDWWEHTGASTYIVGEPFDTPMPNPFWWEIEVDVAEGARLYVQTVGGGGHLSELFMGPITGTFRRYRSQNYSATRFQIQALGDAKFRNFQYCRDGQTVFGSFGRTTNTVPDGSSLQFQIGALSRYAGVIMEVHEGDAPWTPAELFGSGERGGWYDPDDIATLFQNSAGTTPVTAAADPVGNIMDKSGNALTAIQSTAGARPEYRIDGNGNPYLYTDAVDDLLARVNFTGGFAAPAEIYWVGRCGGSGGAGPCGLGLQYVTTGTRFGTLVDVSNRWTGGAPTTTGRYSVNTTDTLTQLAVRGVQVEGRTLRAIRNGVVIATGTAGEDLVTAETASIRISGGGYQTDFYGGVFIFRTLTTDERQKLMTWLGAKAGLVI